MNGKTLSDYTTFYFLDISQHLIVYFILSLIGLVIVYRIESFVFYNEKTKENNKVSKKKLSKARIFLEILFMLAINIIIYITILYVGKAIPSLSNYFYPKLASNSVITFIEDFIILFVLVLGDERLEYQIAHLLD